MSIKLRTQIAERIFEFLKNDIPTNYAAATIKTRKFLYNFELRNNNEEKVPELHFPVIKTRNLYEKYGTTLIKRIAERKIDDNEKLIRNIQVSKDSARGSIVGSSIKIIFKLDTEQFIHDTFENVNKLNTLENPIKRKILIEYSSPNIAKPFHMGHLRSTIIGNFIGNLYKFLGNNVIRLNYLGDWGTQFGLLKIGIDMMKLTTEEMNRNPIENLFKAYVVGNQAAEKNENIFIEARKIFQQLETNENSKELENWENIRKFTIEELKLIYSRLGVEFDEYCWESDYKQKECQKVFDKLEIKNLLLNEFDGRKIVEVGNRRIPIIKSDGTTLYLGRDIAAILDRYEKYHFDRIFYVVDNSQTDHFVACFNIASKIEKELNENRTEHIKFGRIKGMSTRKGNVVFLKDVLNEARDIMMEKQLQSPTTKIDMIKMNDEIADILGVSAVIVNDLKQRRQRDYDFDWNKTLQVNGDTGIKLQYTHCRLCSLLENLQICPAKIPNPNLLNETEAINLIIEIAKFPEILFKTEETLEACILVNYLFSLSNTISRALKRLNVKNQDSRDVQEQRLLLFDTSRKVLSNGMKILGLRVLEKM